jgi:hypothetical protein
MGLQHAFSYSGRTQGQNHVFPRLNGNEPFGDRHFFSAPFINAQANTGNTNRGINTNINMSTYFLAAPNRL